MGNNDTAKGSEAQRQRLRDLYDARTRCSAATEAVMQEGYGAPDGERKAVARALAEAQAELALIEREIKGIEAALPGLVEVEGREAAAAWVRANGPAYRNEMAALVTACQASRTAIEQAATTILAEAALRRALRWRDLAGHVLRARFPDLDGAEALPPLPPLDDYVLPVARALEEAAATVRVPRLTIAHGASDTADQVQRATWKALAKFLPRIAARLPAEVRTIFDRAGVPESETPEQRGRREALERERAAEAARFFGGMGGAAAQAMERHNL